ncbi:MAG: hypothetical protein WCN92_02220 [Eubacteriales bacterium]
MNKIKLRKPPTAVLVAIIIVIVAVSSTVAWLTAGNAVLNRSYTLSNFDAYANVYFQGNTNQETYHNPDGTLSINISSSSADNYIGKLRVEAKFKGKGSAYIRLKMIQQWKDGSGKILQSNTVLPFSISTPYLPGDTGNQSKWYDNRKDDYCFYYATKLKLTNGSYQTIPIIGGFSFIQFNAIVPSGAVSLNVAFTLEAVQINRYPQFWGINTLPWLPDAVTTTAG